MERLKAFARLVRPRHTAQIVGIVAFFSIMSHGFSMQPMFAISASLFLSIAIFLLDDAHDYEADRIAHPERAIPKGLITARQAYLAGTILLCVGCLFASTLPIHQFVIFLCLTAVALAVVFFNFQPLLRAFITAFLIWGLFPFAALPSLKIMLFGLTVGLPHIGGSIAKDFLHSHGDLKQGLEPLPTWSRYVASSAFLLGGAIVWLPLMLNFVGWLYLPPIVVTSATCVWLGISAMKSDYQKVYVYGRIGMFAALVAFLLGEV